VSEMPPMDTPPISPVPAPGLPWEEPNAGLSSIVPTALRIITSPVAAFTQMSLTVDLVRPIAYFVLWALVGACIGQIWNFLFFDSFVGIARSLAGSQFEKFAPFIQKPGALQITVGLVVTPLVALIVLFIWSAIVHLMLTLLGGANRGFATTLRVMCYAETTQVAVVLPGVGGLIGIVWRLILEIVGLAQAHKTEGWKAALAIILPLVLCCVCLVLGIVAFGAALSQALQQLK
jgi:hypothetical protein